LFKSNKAVGVQFLRNNQIYKAFAKSGVILCAGTVGTPKLLMLSGIGPKQHLKELNVNSLFQIVYFNIGFICFVWLIIGIILSIFIILEC
jgi:hypothetical protein